MKAFVECVLGHVRREGHGHSLVEPLLAAEDVRQDVEASFMFAAVSVLE